MIKYMVEIESNAVTPERLKDALEHCINAVESETDLNIIQIEYGNNQKGDPFQDFESWHMK